MITSTATLPFRIEVSRKITCFPMQILYEHDSLLGDDRVMTDDRGHDIMIETCPVPLTRRSDKRTLRLPVMLGCLWFF